VVQPQPDQKIHQRTGSAVVAQPVIRAETINSKVAITAIASGVAVTAALGITPLSGGLAGGTTITIN